MAFGMLVYPTAVVKKTHNKELGQLMSRIRALAGMITNLLPTKIDEIIFSELMAFMSIFYCFT